VAEADRLMQKERRRAAASKTLEKFLPKALYGRLPGN
jgi:hypothetical protein